MIIAWLVRCIAMVVANYLVFQLPEFVDWFPGMKTLLLVVIGLNTLQSLLDVLIPYLIVFQSKIYDRYKIY